jgi:carbon storage regulator
MLVLTRKRGESVDIAGGLIRVIVVELRNGIVRLGFEAPDDIQINRREVELAIAREGKHDATA